MHHETLWRERQKSFAIEYGQRIAQRAKLCLMIERLRTQLHRAEKAIADFDDLPTLWITSLLKPLVDQIVQELPGCHLDPGDFKPRRHFSDGGVTVFLYKNPALPASERLAEINSIYLNCQPGDLAKGEVLYNVSDPVDVAACGLSWQRCKLLRRPLRIYAGK